MNKNNTKPNTAEDMFLLLENLDELYYRTKDKDKKEKLGILFKVLSEKAEKFARAKFDSKDKAYKKVIKSLKRTKKEVLKHFETQLKIEELFKYLTGLTELLDALLFI